MNRSVLQNFDSLLVGVVIAIWVVLISDNPLSIHMAILFGVTSGFIYHFLKQKKERIIKIRKIPAIYLPILVVSFLAFIFALSTSRNSLIFVNWFGIQAADWIWLAIVYVFLSFVPGFLIVSLLDGKNRLSFLPRVVLSLLLSVFLTSQLLYIAEQVPLDSQVTNLFFLTVNGSLVVIYLVKFGLQKKNVIDEEYEHLNVNILIALGLIVLLSAILVYVQQFVYQPFIRGDNWNYLATSNYIDKGSSFLAPLGKFYNIKTMSVYELYNLALFRFSGFPSVNGMMANSLVIASIVPLAFYAMVSSYVKNKKVSLLSTFIYVAFSGFGWIPFVSEKFSLGLQQYLPQDLKVLFVDKVSRVLNDISQPQGSIPEGFKTYILALLSILMLAYLLKSSLAAKARIPLIGLIVAFSFLAHIETILAFFVALLPAYVLLSKRLSEVRKNIVAVTLGVLLTVVIGLSSPDFLIIPFELNYLLVFLNLALLFMFTYIREPLLSRLFGIKRFLSSYKSILLLFVIYVYFLSIITLVSIGYEHMDYGDAVVYSGYTFPWYYYPMSFGVAGTLVMVGLFMDFRKHRFLFFFGLFLLLTITLGIAVSYLNVNFFNTGTKEWRFVYRILPIGTSVFAGWVLFKLMRFFKNPANVDGYSDLVRKTRGIIRPRWSAFLAFTLVIMVGVPSTIIASEYWMSTNATPFGPADGTTSNIELAEYVKKNIPITSRVATIGDAANAVIKLAGGTTAIPTIYPDFLLSNRPETIAFLSSDISFVCIDKTIEVESANYNFVKYLPKIFDNSGFEVYSVPDLEPPSESSLGYLAPTQYDNNTLASYLIAASLNSSYQMAVDDFRDKLTLILPSDMNEDIFPLQRADLMSWVQTGGRLILLGGQGDVINSLDITLNGFQSEVNLIKTNSRILGLKAININPIRSGADVNVLSYYSLNGHNVSPFILEKSLENGAIFYVYLDPIYESMQNNVIDWKTLSEVIATIKDTLQSAGIKFPEPSGDLSRAPLESRWIGKYEVYGTQDFWALGNISTSTLVSGSYFVADQPVVAQRIEITNDSGQIVIENPMLKSLNIYGSAKIVVDSTFFNVSSIEAIPSYVHLKYTESSIKLTPNVGSRIDLELSNKSYSLVDGSVRIESNSSQLILRNPRFTVDGALYLAEVSLPRGTSAWTYNARLVGTFSFGIDYNDGKYFFVKQLIGDYSEVIHPISIVDIVSLTSVLLSLPNVFLTAALILIAILAFRKMKKNDVPG